MLNTPQDQAKNLIEKSQKILILPSSPPDGDSLGSAIALYLVLKKMGKEATVVCADPVPEVYHFLPSEEVITDTFDANRDFYIAVDLSDAELGNVTHTVENGKVNIVITPRKGDISEKNVTFSHGKAKYDLIIVVDTGDPEQLGKLYEEHTEFFFTVPVINIDHHPSNSGFGKVNLVEVTASSTTEMLYEFIRSMDGGKNLIDPDTATALLAGIITDTGSFQNANTTPKSLETAAELVDLGAAQQDIIKNVFKTKHLSMLRLWGRILSKIKTSERHRMLWSVLSQEDFRDTESQPEESGGIIDELMSNAPDMDVIFLLKERSDGLVSGSVRTTSDTINASKIAEMFGGGGHVRAAGFRIHGKSLEEAEKMVIEGIQTFQKERLHLEEIEPEVKEVKTVELPIAPKSEVKTMELPIEPKSEPKPIELPTVPEVKTLEPPAVSDAETLMSTPQPEVKVEEAPVAPESELKTVPIEPVQPISALKPELEPEKIREPELKPETEPEAMPEPKPEAPAPEKTIPRSKIFGSQEEPPENFSFKLPKDLGKTVKKKRGKEAPPADEKNETDNSPTPYSFG